MRVIEALKSHPTAIESKVQELDLTIANKTLSEEERVAAAESRRELATKLEKEEAEIGKLLM